MNSEADSTLAILARLTDRVRAESGERQPCPDLADHEFCDGDAHYIGDPMDRPRPPVTRFCPVPARREVAARVEAERLRLAGQLARCKGGFITYDPTRQQAGEARSAATLALKAARGFSKGRPPSRSLMLRGPLGLGKTHLMLAAYFDLLAAGIRAHFVNSTDLREIFFDCANFDEERAREGEAQRERLVRAQVIFWDDAGDVDGDQRRRGTFAEGLKFLLDRSKAVWAISTNLRHDEARKHPDLGSKALSRIMEGATIVGMDGEDQRLVGES